MDRIDGAQISYMKNSKITVFLDNGSQLELVNTRLARSVKPDYKNIDMILMIQVIMAKVRAEESEIKKYYKLECGILKRRISFENKLMSEEEGDLREEAKKLLNVPAKIGLLIDLISTEKGKSSDCKKIKNHRSINSPRIHKGAEITPRIQKCEGINPEKRENNSSDKESTCNLCGSNHKARLDQPS
jgi:hypothetical protein